MEGTGEMVGIFFTKGKCCSSGLHGVFSVTLWNPTLMGSREKGKRRENVKKPKTGRKKWGKYIIYKSNSPSTHTLHKWAEVCEMRRAEDPSLLN